ncbi:dihydroxyacetone kinase subunit DhaK [Serpentinicella alkaliphila]|uniref:Dihydroxyacetone kinase DhaK subunit n=1 Tax=Serpentinicella alkaliphila TaxID=1734049 RepID=A0A4R2TID1_9FIRM|nr:dihydroxyacetone kinase subunit DhaK [Serpentinicella alkaliphila]QUH26448.1 dihydroxyacetone kinase subunit DhaK [Serpentinicella alkaliphila]TCQ03278.1 dihydroxyacetone kinase DhaK subunit [Serpentinicella alkaliphila]
MKKIINKPENFVDETMTGILYAYGNKVTFLNGDKRILIKNTETKPGKVGIVTAGGSGHLPVFLGYVGEGMIDGCAIGNVFASPSATKMADMIRACDYGSGVLCLYGNYGGDNLNFEMATEEVEFEDIKTTMVRVKDDVASSSKENAEKRRGVAGMVYAFKIAGAAADNMMDLDGVTNVVKKALDNIRTMGVALTPCIVPEVGKPTFTIEDNQMEIGMGIHGEPGIEVGELKTADEIVDIMMEKIIGDIELNEGDEVSIMINGLGATPLEEQLICYKRVYEILEGKGVKIFMPHIGEFATSMEMSGLSITLFKLDEELKTLLRQPATTPFYTNYNK